MIVPLYIRTREADIVHIHYLNAWSSLIATVYCRILNKPYVVHPHGGLEPYHLVKSSRAKVLFELISGTVRNANALVLATETESDRIGAIPPCRKFVVPFGADGLYGRSISATQDPIVLFLSRLAPKKRADILLQAWPKVREQIPNAELHVAGPDTDQLLDGYRHLVSSLGLECSVSFPGQLLGDDKSRAFASAAIFALPSENESFGIAVAEALSAGLPVLLSKYVAIAEDIAAAGAGIVVSSLEPDAWATAIIRLLQDNAARAAMSAAARRLAAETYSWDQVAQRLEHVYCGIVGQQTSVS